MRLGAKLKESGNAFILEELEASSSGAALTDDQIAIAEVADALASDYSLTGAAGSGPTELKSSMDREPFLQGDLRLYRKLETDQLVAGKPLLWVARNLVVPANAKTPFTLPVRRGRKDRGAERIRYPRDGGRFELGGPWLRTRQGWW